MEIYFLLEQHFLVQSDCTFLLLCYKLTRNSAVNAENFAGTTRPTSLFLFPVTRAQSLFYCYLVKKLPYEVRYLGLNKVIFE